MSLKQSVSLPMFHNHISDTDAFLSVLAEVGFRGIEIWRRDEHFDKLSAIANSKGLTISSMLATPVGLNDRAQHADAEKAIRESIDIAAEHGIPNLICFSGNRRNGVSDEEGIATIVEGFSRVAEYAEQKSVTLVLELLNSKVDHIGYQADHTNFGVEVCRRVRSSHVRLLYDIYHMQIMEGDIIRTIRENHTWIAHFHTAGNPGRNDLDDEQELHYAAIAKAVAGLGYEGFIGHEFSPKNDAIKALRQAYSLWCH